MLIFARTRGHEDKSDIEKEWEQKSRRFHRLDFCPHSFSMLELTSKVLAPGHEIAVCGIKNLEGLVHHNGWIAGL